MTVIATLKKTETIPFGEYEAGLVSIDEGEPGPHGDLWLWSFKITSGDYAGVELVGISSTTYSTYPSKSYGWARALGHPPDVDFDASLIEGRPCRLHVKVEEQLDESGEKLGERNRIDSVLAPTKSQLAAQPPSSDEIPF